MPHTFMRQSSRILGFVCLVSQWTLTGIAGAQSQSWLPSRAVEIVSSTGVGGEQDRVARLIQAIVQNNRLLAWPLVVVNKPGGNGALSVAYLNRSVADGHSLLIASGLILSSQIMGQTGINLTDITPIAQLFQEYAVLVVRSQSPIKNARDFIDRLKAAPDSVSIGVTVLGTAHHVSIARAAKAAGVNPKSLKMVTFKSGMDALIATMGGHIDASVSSPANILSALESGAIRAIAISAPQRVAGPLAKVPTWKELGLDSVSANFRIAFGPRGMPDVQIAYWEQILARVVVSEAWTKEVEANAWVAKFLNSTQTRQAIATEYDTLKGMLSELGMARQ